MTLPPFHPEPLTFHGNLIQLEPLSLEHVPGLTAISADPAIWRYMLYGVVDTEEKMSAWVQDLLTRQAAGGDLPFAVRHLPSGRIAGATRYLDIRPAHRGLEIGGTWYGTEFQRSGVNTEAKFLLLRHAFETLGAIRVQFKADSRNEKSLRAIERIGATREGTLRKHMLLADGVERDSVYFSILDEEWPAVRRHLETLLLPR